MDLGRILGIDVPPVAGAWIQATAACAVLTLLNMVSEYRLMFIPANVRQEPWRIFTSFLFFSKLDISLIHHMLISLRAVASLERDYTYSIDYLPAGTTEGLDDTSMSELAQQIDLNRPWDFGYFLARLAVSLLVAVYVVNRETNIMNDYVFMGPALVRCCIYLLSRNRPAMRLNLLGFDFKIKYLPYVQPIMELILHPAYYMAWSKPGGPVFKAADFRELFFRHAIPDCIAYVHWFLQYCYLGSVHGDTSAPYNVACNKFADPVLKYWTVPNLVRWLTTPVWYHETARRLRLKQTRRLLFEAAQEAQATNEAPNEQQAENAETSGAATETNEPPTTEVNVSTTEDNVATTEANVSSTEASVPTTEMNERPSSGIDLRALYQERQLNKARREALEAAQAALDPQQAQSALLRTSGDSDTGLDGSGPNASSAAEQFLEVPEIDGSTGVERP